MRTEAIPFTDTQCQIIVRAVACWSDHAIARELKVATHTIERHWRNIYTLLQAKNRCNAIAIAADRWHFPRPGRSDWQRISALHACQPLASDIALVANLASGMTYGQIARRAIEEQIKEASIETRVRRACRRIGAQNRYHAVYLLVWAGFVAYQPLSGSKR